MMHNKNILYTNNLSYFFKKPNNEEFHNANKWVIRPESSQFANGYMIHNPLKLSELLSNCFGDVIISAENFSFIFMKNELVKFKKSMDKYFDKIKIIVYLRRQDAHAVSHHNQGSKYLTPMQDFLFTNIPLALPNNKLHAKQYLDYHQKLIKWADVFGKENITIRVFSKQTLINGDAVSDFFHLLGIEEFTNSLKINESNGLEKTKVGLLMNQAKVSNGPLRNIIHQNLESKNKFLPKREDAKRFYEQYRESNIALNKMFNISEKNEAIFDEDFSMYPEEGNELWTEESANETITTILRSLNETYGTINYNTLFKAALKLEKIDFNLTYQIMQMLYKLLPQDPNVQKKLISYNTFLNK